MWKGDRTVPNRGRAACGAQWALLLRPRAAPTPQLLPSGCSSLAAAAQTPMFPEMGLVAGEKQGANEQQKPAMLQHGLQSPPAALTGFITHEGSSGVFQGGQESAFRYFEVIRAQKAARHTAALNNAPASGFINGWQRRGSASRPGRKPPRLSLQTRREEEEKALERARDGGRGSPTGTASEIASAMAPPPPHGGGQWAWLRRLPAFAPLRAHATSPPPPPPSTRAPQRPPSLRVTCPPLPSPAANGRARRGPRSLYKAALRAAAPAVRRWRRREWVCARGGACGGFPAAAVRAGAR